jgi:hypothetical protein
MAKETATLTFELEDQFSAKMQEITGKLEDFKRRLDETSRKGTEGFAEIGRQVKGVGEQAHGAIQHFSQIKSVSVEVTRALTGLSGGFGEVGMALRKAVSAGSEFSGILGVLRPERVRGERAELIGFHECAFKNRELLIIRGQPSFLTVEEMV